MDSLQTRAIRRVYEAINRRDIDAVLERLSPAIELRMPMDPLRVHPVFGGHDGVRSFYAVLFEALEVYRAELDTVHDLGRGVVVAVGRFTVRPRGSVAEHTVRFSHFWEVRDGQAARVSLHEADNPLALIDSGARKPAVEAAAA